MKSNNTWKVSLLVTILVIGVLRAAPPESTTEPKTVKLFAREAWITVVGKTTTVMTLTQANGEEGYSPEQAKGFHVEVVNQLPVSTSIHWHGLILPSLMDGVPFVSQDPIPPGGSHPIRFSPRAERELLDAFPLQTARAAASSRADGDSLAGAVQVG